MLPTLTSESLAERAEDRGLNLVTKLSGVGGACAQSHMAKETSETWKQTKCKLNRSCLSNVCS